MYVYQPLKIYIDIECHKEKKFAKDTPNKVISVDLLVSPSPTSHRAYNPFVVFNGSSLI